MKRRLFTTIALGLGLVFAPTGLAAHADSSANNVVDIFNQRDGSTLPRSSTVLTESSGGTVDNTNFAHAKATCVSCRTVAVAVQVLVVEGPTNDFRPVNVAFAENVQCSLCQTFAYANQIVLTPLHPIDPGSISRDTWRRAAEIRDQITATTRSNMSFADMSAQLDSLTAQLRQLATDAIAKAGSGTTDQEHRQLDEKD